MTSNAPEHQPHQSERDDPHPNQPGSKEANPEKETTPAGVARELEDMAEETDGASD
jgi:hypothetical protein